MRSSRSVEQIPLSVAYINSILRSKLILAWIILNVALTLFFSLLSAQAAHQGEAGREGEAGCWRSELSKYRKFASCLPYY